MKLNGFVTLSGLVLAATMLPAVAVDAATMTFGASKDNTLYEDPTGGLSNGAGPHFFVGRSNQGTGSIRRGLVAFDLSSIPAGATVTSATLTLSVTKTIALPTTVQLNRVLHSWGEGTSFTDPGGTGTFSTTNDATWKHRFFNGTNWDNLGGDFVAVASASSPVNGPGAQTWSGAGLVSDVRGWLNNPASNFGWELLGDESKIGTAYQFGTHENTVATDRPSLSVTFTVPEPGSLALIGAALVLVRRRR
jgi:hypothetical protein